MPTDPYIWLLLVTAALLVGLSKTGVPGVALPAILFMAQAFPGQETLSVGALLPLLLVGDVMAVAYYRRHAQWGKLFGLLPAVAVGMVPGLVVLNYVDDQYFKLILGWMILGLLALDLVRKRFGKEGAVHHWWFTLSMGLLAGFGTVLANAAGPVMTIYLVGRGLEKQQFMGTWAWFFLIVNAIKVPLYGGSHLITAQTLQLDLVLVGLVVVGGLIGRRVFRLIPQRLFDVLVLVMAAVAAVKMIVW